MLEIVYDRGLGSCFVQNLLVMIICSGWEFGWRIWFSGGSIPVSLKNYLVERKTYKVSRSFCHPLMSSQHVLPDPDRSFQTNLVPLIDTDGEKSGLRCFMFDTKPHGKSVWAVLWGRDMWKWQALYLKNHQRIAFSFTVKHGSWSFCILVPTPGAPLVLPSFCPQHKSGPLAVTQCTYPTWEPAPVLNFLVPR